MSKVFTIQESLEEDSDQSIILIRMKTSNIIFVLVLIFMIGFFLAFGSLITINGFMNKNSVCLTFGPLLLLLTFSISWFIYKFIKEKGHSIHLNF